MDIINIISTLFSIASITIALFFFWKSTAQNRLLKDAEKDLLELSKLKSEQGEQTSTLLQNLQEVETSKANLILINQDLQRELSDIKRKLTNEEEAIQLASSKAKEIIQKAKLESQDIEKRTNEILSHEKSRIDKDKNELIEQEKRLDQREQALLQRNKNLDERFSKLDEQEKTLDEKGEELKSQFRQVEDELLKIASLTRDEATKLVQTKIEDELTNWTAKRIKQQSKLVELESEERAKSILMDAMVQGATDYIADVAISRFRLETEEQKGKIIGKEGRNIKTLEKLTGTEIMIDEDSPTITISCFDPIRREVAAISIARLLKDGRMHPGTIEETVDKVKSDLLKIIKKEGEELAFKSGFTDLPDELVKLIGKFKYRFSYGQNLAKHVLEMVQIGESIANELKADVQAVKLACLLHDLGKVVITDSLGQDNRQHHHISGEYARKYNLGEKVINAIEAHHDDIASEYIEAEIVKLADKISGSRSGARRETYEEYIARIKVIEDVANSYDGVKDAYAIYAGREVRVLVQSDKLDDNQCIILAKDISDEISDSGKYPGGVKVTIIREFRISSSTGRE